MNFKRIKKSKLALKVKMKFECFNICNGIVKTRAPSYINICFVVL